MGNTKKLENASIYVNTDNGTFRFANCEAIIEVVENTQTLKMPARDTEYKVKTYNAALIICNKADFVYDNIVNIDFLKKIQNFHVDFEPVKANFDGGEISVSGFSDITPVEIDLNGEWRFDITNHIGTVKKLFPELIFG